MPNTREKLMRLLCTANSKAIEAEAFEDATYAEQLGIQADHLIANGVTVQEWISVKDRLPESNKKVLATKMGADKRFVFWGKYSNERWVDLEWSCYRYGVTHWMPLPQPPKGE